MRIETIAAAAAVIFVSVAAIVVLSVAAFAADYPTSPITLIVPYPAGGGNDVIARLVAAKMSASLGQPIVIENRGGAGSTIGTRDAARRLPDGYTLLIATSSLAINPSLYPDAGYDPKKDFAAVGLIASSPNLVLVNPSVPAHSIADLIALAKREPGGLNFASTGTGTSTHLSAELFAAMASVKLNPIPYKGVAPALIDLVAGQVPLMFCPTASVIGLVRQASGAGAGHDRRKEVARCFRICRPSPKPDCRATMRSCIMVSSCRPVRRRRSWPS